MDDFVAFETALHIPTKVGPFKAEPCATQQWTEFLRRCQPTTTARINEILQGFH